MVHPTGKTTCDNRNYERVQLKPSDSVQIDAFVASIRNINDVGLSHLHALSIAVGWPHRAEDWQFLRQVGLGIVALDEIERPIGSAMWFPYGEDVATIGMVITSPRLQTNGTAQWLMQHVLGETRGRNLRLNATRAAQRLYLSLDFQSEKTVYQRQGTVRLSVATRERETTGFVRQLQDEDAPAVIACDALAFGVSRHSVISALFAHSSAYGVFREDKLCAFALCRSFGRGHVVGPVVAANDDDAIAVVRPHVLEHDGMFLRLDTHRESGDFVAFLMENGLSVFDTMLTMSLGKRLADFVPDEANPPVTYALASHTLG
jgi:GNAT superfamily N-acetyltransferase